MAKKNTEGTAAAPRRASTTKRIPGKGPAAAPVDIAGMTPVEPIDSASDMASAPAESAYHPSYDDIAQEAYRRYLSRGGSDGRDFDDWIEAEQELVRRRRH